jgi:hypothetical protein
MTLAEVTQVPVPTSDPFHIIDGPQLMDMMLALFNSNRVYFTLDRRRDVRTTIINGLKKIDSNSGNWEIEGRIQTPDGWRSFLATYFMQGGNRTGSLRYTD